MKERVLILAPRGRDAAIAADLVSRNAITAEICADQAALVTALDEGAGAVLLTEEALVSAGPARLTDWVAQQGAWSDIPFVVLANGSTTPRSSAATRRLGELGNVVLLERPLHAEAMLGALRSALKARARQYEIRDAADTLERAVVDRTAELAAARDSLEIALEAAEMGGWDMNLVTGETRRTSRHDEIFGYDTALTHWSFEVFLGHVDPDQRDEVAKQFETALKCGVLDFETAITTATGAHRCIVAKGRVQYDSAHTPVRMTGVVSDVTERKDTDAQLAQAQKMDAIGQLTGGVAHDFNNLLTPIVGSLDLIRRRHSDDEKTQRLISGALQAAERAATLTQRLLAFARRQALQPRAVDIGALIEGIVDLIRRSLGPSVDVALDVPNDLATARVDPNQLELALLNLAINARDAMPGGGRLTIAVSDAVVASDDQLGLRAGRYVRIIAADTGIGMDHATLTRATEPFFSTKGVGKGTGLGLSMVHGLAAQSGGTIRLSSELGVGTAVELWLPATEEPATNIAEPRSEPIAARRAATVLLVDDEELVRSATANMLRDIGYVVIELGSGSQALSAIRAGVDIDILVSDYLMPGMTGGQLVQEIRDAGIDIPTLLVTGYAASGDDVPDDVQRLAKPFRQVDLAARVDELLRATAPPSSRARAIEQAARAIEIQPNSAV